MSWLSVDDIARSRNAGMTAHDYDLSTLLLLQRSSMHPFEPNILGVPEGMSEEQSTSRLCSGAGEIFERVLL